MTHDEIDAAVGAAREWMHERFPGETRRLLSGGTCFTPRPELSWAYDLGDGIVLTVTAREWGVEASEACSISFLPLDRPKFHNLKGTVAGLWDKILGAWIRLCTRKAATA